MVRCVAPNVGMSVWCLFLTRYLNSVYYFSLMSFCQYQRIMSCPAWLSRGHELFSTKCQTTEVSSVTYLVRKRSGGSYHLRNWICFVLNGKISVIFALNLSATLFAACNGTELSTFLSEGLWSSLNYIWQFCAFSCLRIKLFEKKHGGPLRDHTHVQHLLFSPLTACIQNDFCKTILIDLNKNKFCVVYFCSKSNSFIHVYTLLFKGFGSVSVRIWN